MGWLKHGHLFVLVAQLHTGLRRTDVRRVWARELCHSVTPRIARTDRAHLSRIATSTQRGTACPALRAYITLKGALHVPALEPPHGV